MHRTPKPIIAALNGWVIGGGIELALACDIRIASDQANFGFFHIRRGMHFADGGIVRLVNTVGVGMAMELDDKKQRPGSLTTYELIQSLEKKAKTKKKKKK